MSALFLSRLINSKDSDLSFLSQIIDGALLLVPVIVLTFLSIMGLWNSLSFDEAYNLQVPREVLSGKGYGTAIVDEWRPFDVRITTGPTVMLPAIALMRILGESAPVGRIVIVVYGAIFYISVALTLRRVAGRMAPILGFIGFAYLWLFETASRFLGEIPSLAFIGLALFSLVFFHESIRKGLLIGLFLGLALLTKMQWLLVVIPLATCIAYAIIQGKEKVTYIYALIAVFIPLILWYIVQASMIGLSVTWNHLLALQRFQGVAATLGTWDFVIRRVASIPTYEMVVLAFGIIGSLFLLEQPRHALWYVFALTLVVTYFAWRLLFSDGNLRFALTWRPFNLLLAAAAAEGLFAFILGKATRLLERVPIFSSESKEFNSGSAITASVSFILALFAFVEFVGFSVSVYTPYSAFVSSVHQEYVDQIALSAWARQEYLQGKMICGFGWWMPWEIGFLGNIDLCDLSNGAFAESDADLVLIPALKTYPPDARRVREMLDGRNAVLVSQKGDYFVYHVPPEIHR